MPLNPTPIPRSALIDALRGWFLAIMATNHFGGALTAITWQPLGFVSAAEGFFFLSGLMSGVVLTRSRHATSQVARRRWAASRFRRIYAAHLWTMTGVIATVVALTAWIPGTAMTWSTPWRPIAASPAGAAIAGALLVYLPVPLDVLPIYCALVLAAPWVVREVEAGRLARVATVSIGCWLLSQATRGRVLHWLLRGMPLADAPDFDILGWQLVFVGGVVAGVLVPRRPEAMPRMTARPWAVLVGGAIAMFTLRHAGVLGGTAFDAFASRPTLGPIRVVNFAILAALVWLAPRAVGRVVAARPLALLGRHSLSVFATHVVLLAAVTPWRATIAAAGSAWETLAALAFVAALFVPALIAERRTRARTAAPPSRSSHAA